MASLQDICLLITDGKHGDCQNEEWSGYYFISCKDVKDGWIDYTGARQITESDYLDTHRRTQLEPNDILITNSGTIGRMALVPRVSETSRTTFQKSVAIIKPNRENVVPIWLYFCLMAKKDALIAWAGGTAQKNLLLRDLRAFKVKVPPLPTQRKIASILSAYDDLIENNTRRIKILEEMAQTTYREWFVKFRYPGHEKVRMVESELGMIPEGWEVKTLGDVFDIKYGKGLPTKELLECGEYPVYGAGSVIGYYNELVVDKKVALITCRGNGSGTVWRTREPAFITNNSFLIIPKEEFAHLEYHFVEQLCLNTNIKSALSGSAQPQITITGLSTVKCIIPKSDIVEKYCESFGDAAELIDALYKKNQNLRQTRDLLLPKLISGELDVSELDIETGGKDI